MTVSKHLAALPNPGPYARAWRRLVKFDGDKTRRVVDLGFPRGLVSVAEALAEYRRALDRRINTRGGLVRAGRKYDEQYQGEMFRDARALHEHLTCRVRVYRFNTPEMNKRFAHLLADRND